MVPWISEVIYADLFLKKTHCHHNSVGLNFCNIVPSGNKIECRYPLFYRCGTFPLGKHSVFCFQMSLCRCAENPYSIIYQTILIKILHLSLSMHYAFPNALGENKYNSIIKIRHAVISALNYYNVYYTCEKDASFQCTGHFFSQRIFTECLNESQRHYKWSDISGVLLYNRNILTAYNENRSKGKFKVRVWTGQGSEWSACLMFPFCKQRKKWRNLLN